MLQSELLVREDVHEGMENAKDGVKYARYVAGARRCPTEDCGGMQGYAEFLETVANPAHPEHESTLQWVGGRYDPDEFDPNMVRFDDPRKRWKKAFAEELLVGDDGVAVEKFLKRPATHWVTPDAAESG